MNRRGFLGAMLVAGVAPAIVQAANIMPVFVRKEVGGLLVPELSFEMNVTATELGNRLVTFEEITREALLLFQQNLSFSQKVNLEFERGFR